MAYHIAQQLVAAVKTRVTSLTTTGANVFGYRVNPLQATELPGLCVYAIGDDVVDQSIHSPPVYGRSIEIHVVGYASLNTALDDTLNLIWQEVETALGTAFTIGGKSFQMIYRGAEKTFEPGEKQAGEIDLRFTILLYSAANTPTVFQ